MKTGFLILNYHSWEMTKNLARKAAAFKNIDVVMVVDNHSADDSYCQLCKLKGEESSGEIYVLQTPKNGGYAYGNNYGAKMCQRLGVEVLFFSNPDVNIEEVYIQKILAQFDNTGYSVLSGIEYDGQGKMVQPPLWKRMSYLEDLGDCFYLCRLKRKFRGKKGCAVWKGTAPVQQAEMVKGSFFAVRLKDFLDVGGFDERVFLYCEERILSKKMEDAGRKIGIVTDAVYIHTHTASICQKYEKIYPRMKLLYRARLLYQRDYDRIGKMRYALLWGAMKISLFEYRIRDWLKSVRKGTGCI